MAFAAPPNYSLLDSQLAEEYGSDVATEILARARTGMPVGFAGTSQINLGLDTPVSTHTIALVRALSSHSFDAAPADYAIHQ